MRPSRPARSRLAVTPLEARDTPAALAFLTEPTYTTQGGATLTHSTDQFNNFMSVYYHLDGATGGVGGNGVVHESAFSATGPLTLAVNPTVPGEVAGQLRRVRVTWSTDSIVSTSTVLGTPLGVGGQITVSAAVAGGPSVFLHADTPAPGTYKQIQDGGTFDLIIPLGSPAVFDLEASGTGKSYSNLDPSAYSSTNGRVQLNYQFDLYGAPVDGTDLVAKRVAWDAGTKSFRAEYTVLGEPTPTATKAAVYWASGPTAADVLGKPIATKPIPQGTTGTGFVAVKYASLPKPPAGATHLALVLDQDQAVDEVVESNNAAAFDYRPDVVVKSIKWTPGKGGAEVVYDVKGRSLVSDEAPELAFFWGKGQDRAGGPLFSVPIDGEVGANKKARIEYADLKDLPFVADPVAAIGAGQNLLAADHLRAVFDADSQFAEWNPGGTAEGNNTKDLKLAKVTARPGKFHVSFTHPVSGETTLLNSGLFDSFMGLARNLVGRNLVGGDIVLEDGVRDPMVAHRWSTAWMIRFGRETKYKALSDQLLANLRALPGGQDLDGNVWYKAEWEDAVRAKLADQGKDFEEAGQLTKAAKDLLWPLIEAHVKNERFDDRSPGSQTKVAADGYAKTDPRRMPNAYPAEQPSKHVFGMAIDATIPWRKGAWTPDGKITTGRQYPHGGEGADPAATALVSAEGLFRPEPTEKHHFEWGNA